MTPDLKYLRYVLLHKFYVFRAGLALRKVCQVPEPLWRWVWRLLVHDLSKFSLAEWTPYVDQFYGEIPEPSYGDARMLPGAVGPEEVAQLKRDRQAKFNAAWLHHIHANPHHWQHHILHEDSGKVIVLIPHAALVHEMVADWLAAGPKALRAHTMGEAVAETIAWYARVYKAQQMREIVRQTAESLLLQLAEHYGVAAMAQDIRSAQATRAAITIPGR